MQFKRNQIKLSGKGFYSTDELLADNVKVKTEETQFLEIIAKDDEKETEQRVGWFVPNKFELWADFIIHTDLGMQGKSTHDKVERAIVLDSSLIQKLVPEEIITLDISQYDDVLTEILGNKEFEGKIDFEDEDVFESIIIISPASDLLFVQKDEASIRLHQNDGIYILQKSGEREKLVMMDKDDGIGIFGDKDLHIGIDGIHINGKKFDLSKIIGSAISGIAPIIASLGALGNLGNFEHSFNEDFDSHMDMSEFERKMEKMGEKLGQMGEKMAEKFGKNFVDNFDQFNPDDFDDDSEYHDVDVEY